MQVNFFALSAYYVQENKQGNDYQGISNHCRCRGVVASDLYTVCALACVGSVRALILLYSDT